MPVKAPGQLQSQATGSHWHDSKGCIRFLTEERQWDDREKKKQAYHDLTLFLTCVYVVILSFVHLYIYDFPPPSLPPITHSLSFAIPFHSISSPSFVSRLLLPSFPFTSFLISHRTQQPSDSRADQSYSRPNGDYDPSGVTLQSAAHLPPMNNGRSGLQTPISDQAQSRSANPQQQMHVGNSEYQQRQLDGDGADYTEQRRGGNKFLNFLLCRCG